MFDKFRKWLNGVFVCKDCGKTWIAPYSFGFGLIICPECYGKHNPHPIGEWFFPDLTYWLNRLLFKNRRVNFV